MRESIKCTDNFDINFTDSLSIEVVSDSVSIGNMLYLDFSSNNDWELDDRLGLNWINSDNTGLLQLKRQETLIVSEVQKKLSDTDGIQDIKEIELNRTLGRKYTINATVTTVDGDEFTIGNEVS